MLHRCWTFGGVDQPVSVVRAARRVGVDAIWFHLHLTSAGNSRPSWFAGLAAPAAARAAGFTTIVTLHNMLGFTDVKWAGPEITWLDRLAAHGATTLLRAANVVCVLTPEYLELLPRRYGVRRVQFVPHGTLGTPADAPAPEAAADRSILAFGHFGSYKRLEPLLEVASELRDGPSAVTVSIAGSDSRHSNGYLAQLQRSHTLSNVTFLGYVPEADVPAMFRRASICVLPYATTAGMSGVAIQAAMYGVPIVASDIPGFRSLQASGLRLDFFDWRDNHSLESTILKVLASAERRVDAAMHNLEYSRRQTMDMVVDRYLDIIEGEVSARRTVAARSAASDDPVAVWPR